jgi:hypothetical protein
MPRHTRALQGTLGILGPADIEGPPDGRCDIIEDGRVTLDL